jgi:hypothetical protein
MRAIKKLHKRYPPKTTNEGKNAEEVLSVVFAINPKRKAAVP